MDAPVPLGLKEYIQRDLTEAVAHSAEGNMTVRKRTSETELTREQKGKVCTAGRGKVTMGFQSTVLLLWLPFGA